MDSNLSATKVSRAVWKAERHLHRQIVGIWQILWRSIMESPNLNTLPIWDERCCWKSCTQSKRRNISSTVTIGLGRKMVGWFYGMLFLSAKCPRPNRQRETVRAKRHPNPNRHRETVAMQGTDTLINCHTWITSPRTQILLKESINCLSLKITKRLSNWSLKAEVQRWDVKNSQSCSWLVVWPNQFGLPDPNQICWHQKPTRRHSNQR